MTDIFESVDPVSGRPVLHIPNLGPKDKDDPARLALPVPAHGSQYVAEMVAAKDRAEAIAELAAAGVELPTSVGDAQAVLQALQAVPVAVPVPRINDADPAEATAILAAYIDARARQTVAADAKSVVVSQAVARVEAALSSALDVILAGLAKPFTADAKILADNAEVITRYRTAAEAAEADETGQAVAAFHLARRSAERLNRTVDLILKVNRRPGTALRSSEDAPRLHCLVADFSEADSILQIAHASDDVQRGKLKPDSPMGSYPAILASGATLSLAKTSAEWSDRVEDYRSRCDAAAMEIFR